MSIQSLLVDNELNIICNTIESSEVQTVVAPPVGSVTLNTVYNNVFIAGKIVNITYRKIGQIVYVSVPEIRIPQQPNNSLLDIVVDDIPFLPIEPVPVDPPADNQYHIGYITTYSNNIANGGGVLYGYKRIGGAGDFHKMFTFNYGGTPFDPTLAPFAGIKGPSATFYYLTA